MRKRVKPFHWGIVMKKIVLGVLLSLAFAAPAAAKETKLSEVQIRELFVGQTIKGIHYGKETRQYFSKSGLTLWVSEGDETLAEGRYEIKNGQYCSSWTGLWSWDILCQRK